MTPPRPKPRHSPLRRAGVLGLSFLGLATAIGASAQESPPMPNPSSTEQQLITIYRQMHRFMLAADTPSLKAMLADGFSLVHITGYAQPRDEWLAQIDSGRMRYFSSAEDEVPTVKVGYQRATLRGRNRVKASIWGAEGLWPLQMDIEFVLVNGKRLMGHARASTY